MNSKHAFLVLSTFTLVSIAYGEREVFAPTKLAPVATGANGKVIIAADTPFFTGGNIYAPNPLGIGTTTASVVGLFTQNTERMRISSTGQVQVNGGATSLPSSTDSTVAVASGGYATTGNISNAIYGSTRGILLLGGNYTAGTADVAGIKFLYGPRSTTSENTATIASVAANNTDTTANSGGSVLISTRPASGALTERMRITADGLTQINRAIELGNTITDYPVSTAPQIYSTGNGTGIFADYGNLVLQPRSSGALRNIIFANGNPATERMRIDSSGNVGIGTNTNLSTLTINGPIAPKGPTDVNAATYTVQTTDSSLRFTTTNCTVTLPAAASFPGRILWLNTVTANSVTSNASNVIPLGSNTAGTAIFAATAGKFAMIQSNGTNWVTMMSN